MELRQLAYFVAVTETANFTRAAARLHVAQPGVSAQIRLLEKELGQPLLDRSGRTVRLTEAGAAVLPHARAALASVEAVRHAVDELTGLIRGRVAVGMVTSLQARFDLPGLLAGFHQDHPGVEITLTEDRTDHLIEALRTGRLDLAIVALPGATPPGLATETIVDEPFVAVVAPDDPMADRTEADLAAIADRALLVLPRGTGMRTCIDDAYAAAGLEPHIAFEAGDPNLLAHFAARGLGMAIIPTSLAETHPEHLHTITITHPHLHGRLALAWPTNTPTSPAAQTLTHRARTWLTTRPT